MSPSPALEERIREHFARLEALHAHAVVTGCDVVITAPTGHHQQGAPFDVRVNVTLPDRQLHVQNGAANPAHVDAYLAVRDAFDALERMMRRHLHTLHRHREHDSIRRGT
jgi:ribosome-associated translation inhibitor RaiA